MKALFSLVGRAGFEPATNGLKVRYAHSAKRSVRGGFSVHGSPEVPFSPIGGQKSPHCPMSSREPRLCKYPPLIARWR